MLQVDATTARIHWEMVSQPDPVLAEEAPSSDERHVRLPWHLPRFDSPAQDDLRPAIPQPARNHQAVPRVLVVADPSRDHPL